MVRAHFLQLALGALRRTDPSLHALVGERLPEVASSIESARKLGWLPIEHLLALSDLAVAEVGVDGLRRFVHHTMRAAHGAEPWGRLIQVAIGLFGLGPADVARWAPRVYGLTFRGVGRMQVIVADRKRAEILFTDVPQHCLDHPHHLASLRHALEYFFTLTQTTGVVRLLESGRGRARFELVVAPPAETL